jgi:hypothetical protein
MNTVGLPSNVISNITAEHDIDRVSASYLDAIQAEIANSIPNSRVLDRVSLYKKIVKYYSIRGTSDSAMVFFRIFFDELIELIYPKDYLFKTSDGSGKVIPAQFEIDRILTDAPISAEPEYITINPIDSTFILSDTDILTATPEILTVTESSLTLDGINIFTFDTLNRISDLNGRARYASSTDPSQVLYWDSSNIRWVLTVEGYAWFSYSNVINPQDAINWNPSIDEESTAATLTIDQFGLNNTVTYVANVAGLFGNNISIAYASAIQQAITSVAVSGTQITVTPGTTARMIVSGSLTRYDNNQPITTGVFLEAGTFGEKPYWSSDGLSYGAYRTNDYSEILYASGQTKYYLNAKVGITNDAVYYCSSEITISDDPSSILWNTAAFGNGTPTVTSGISSALQIISAINTSTEASALVTAFAEGNVTGTITTTLLPTNLSGGINGWLSPIGTFTTTYFVNNTGATVPQSLGELVVVLGTDDVYECTDFNHYTWEPSIKNVFDTWKYSDRKGFISDRNKIQDGYRWQEYSYGIRTGIQLEDWEKAYLKLVHPAGLYLFSELLVLVFRSNVWDNYINYGSTNPTVDLTWLNAFISPRVLDPSSNAFHSPKFQPGWLSSNNRKLRFIIAALIAEGAEANFIRAVYVICQSIIAASNSSSEESQRDYLEYLKFWDDTSLSDGYADITIADAMQNKITHVGSVRGSWYPWSNSTFEYDQATTYVSPTQSIQYPDLGWEMALFNNTDIPYELNWEAAQVCTGGECGTLIDQPIIGIQFENILFEDGSDIILNDNNIILL